MTNAIETQIYNKFYYQTHKEEKKTPIYCKICKGQYSYSGKNRHEQRQKHAKALKKVIVQEEE